MNKLERLLVLSLVAMLDCIAIGLSVSDLSVFDSYNVKKGRRLMELLDIPSVVNHTTAVSWHSPTSVVLHAQRYAVKVDSADGDFTMISLTNANERIAYGNVCVMGNGVDARLGAFASISNCSVPVDGMASYVIMQPVDVPTNVFYLTYSIQSPRTPVYYVHKNVCLEVYSATNRVQIANALMNAGLSESERVQLPPTEEMRR